MLKKYYLLNYYIIKAFPYYVVSMWLVVFMPQLNKYLFPLTQKMIFLEEEADIFFLYAKNFVRC
jgi:hypothetical protein